MLSKAPHGGHLKRGLLQVEGAVTSRSGCQMLRLSSRSGSQVRDICDLLNRSTDCTMTNHQLSAVRVQGICQVGILSLLKVWAGQETGVDLRQSSNEKSHKDVKEKGL